MSPIRRALLLALAGPVMGAQGQAGWKVFGSDQYGRLLFLREARPQGLLVERLRATESLSGDRFELELLNWPRALALAGSGQGGLIGVSHTPERAQWLDYSLPMYQDELRLVVRADSNLRFSRVEDLRGLRIGMVRATTGGLAFDTAAAAGDFHLIRDWNASERLRALLAGRLDAAVFSNGQWGLDAVLAATPDLQSRRAELRLLEPPLLIDALHLAFPKSMEAGAVLARFNAALKKLGAA